MKALRWIALLAVALSTCVPSVAGAKPPGGAVISPARAAAGLSGGELLGETWADELEVPADAFAGSCHYVGKNDKVAVPVPGDDLTASCTVRPGSPVYILPGSECSDVEEDPFFGADAAAQRACAIEFDHDYFLSVRISVDGGSPVETVTPRFEVVSPQMSVNLAPDNFLGVPPGPATFVAHAWGSLVRGLSPGEHVISADVSTSDGVSDTVVYTIDVVPRGRGG